MSAPSGMPNTVARFVVDANVAIKWFVPEIHADAARRLLREGITLLAPDRIWAEVANALWRKWREKELTVEAVEGILNDFRRYRLHIQSGESLYDVAWATGQASGRTFYDSLYLALAMSNGCPLVTTDLRFLNAIKTRPGLGIACGWKTCPDPGPSCNATTFLGRFLTCPGSWTPETLRHFQTP